MRIIDLTGKRFGRLIVLRRNGSDSQSSAVWLCRCECGAEKAIRGSALRNGVTKSCGCLKRETLGKSGYKHGGCGTPTWNVWRGIIKRCTYRRCKQYGYYGARGIRVCDRWLDFENFLLDMGERPPGASIERVDVNGNYEPGNCEWIHLEKQACNTRRTIRVEVNGTTMCLKEACETLGLKYARVRDRMRTLGWSFDKAISEPKKVNGTVYAEEVDSEVC